jgi:hypothetical protein
LVFLLYQYYYIQYHQNHYHYHHDTSESIFNGIHFGELPGNTDCQPGLQFLFCRYVISALRLYTVLPGANFTIQENPRKAGEMFFAAGGAVFSTFCLSGKAAKSFLLGF